MIELTLGELRNPMFNQALQALASKKELPFKTSYHISRIVKLIDSEQRQATEAYSALLKEWGTSEDGGQNYTIAEEKRPEFSKVAKEFIETKITIDRNKINVSDLSQLSMAPSDFLVLEPLLYNLELLEGGFDGKDNEEKSETKS